MHTLYRGSLTPAHPAKLAQKSFAFRTGSRWILMIVLCLGLVTPGASAFANGPALAPSAVPVVGTKIDLNLPISTTATITSAFLHATDPGTLPGSLVFTAVSSVTLGTLKLGATPLVNTSTFTQQDINNGSLSFTAPASVGTDSFTFNVKNATDTSVDLVYTIHVNKAESTTYPSDFSAAAVSVSQITTTWTDVAGGNAPDGYLVLCTSGFSSPSPHLDTPFPIDNACTDGAGSIHVPKGVGTFTWDGLNSESSYNFAIFPYVQTPYPQNTGSFFDYGTAGGWPLAAATTLKTYSISGMVVDDTLPADGGPFPIMGALVDAGGGHTAVSDEDGKYAITGLTPGDYTLSASLACYTFAPISQSITVSDINNHPGVGDFTGTKWICIAGTIRDGTRPLAGVMVSDGDGHTISTLADGSYSFLVPSHWSGTLAPTLRNFTFTPDRRTYFDVTSNQYVQSYNARLLDIQWNGFTAVWNAAAGVTGYTLDVATDAGFTNFVPGYQGKDVGSVTQLDVTGLTAHTHYFFRVRAYDLNQADGYSIPTEVVTDYGLFFPIIAD